MDYALISPIRNEKENLLLLKKTVLNQVKIPSAWVIVDGDSHDGSYTIAQEIFGEFRWVHVIRQQTFFGKEYSHKNIAQAVNEGYVFVKKICDENNIPYIGKVDASVELDANYFHILLNGMEMDEKLAISCGKGHCTVDTHPTVFDKIATKDVMSGFNDNRLYRKEFLDEVGGYPLTYSPDTILLIKAMNRGWRIRIFPDTFYVDNRIGGSKIGMWKGFKLKGRALYHLGYHPLLVIGNFVYLCMTYSPHHCGFALLQGYLESLVKHEGHIEDGEVYSYFHRQRLREIAKTLLPKIPKTHLE